MGWSPAAAEQTEHCSHSPGRLELLIPDCSPQDSLTHHMLLGSTAEFSSHLLAQMCPFQRGRERQRENQKERFSSYVHPQGAEPVSICCLRQPSEEDAFGNEQRRPLSIEPQAGVWIKPTCQLCSSMALFSFFFSQVAKSVVFVVCCALKKWGLLSLVSSLGC